MIDVNWQHGNFFQRDFNGISYYGAVLSSCEKCGKIHAVLIPENFDIEETSPLGFVEFYSDLEKIQGFENSNSREFIVPVREVDIPKRVAFCLGIFSSGWYFSRHSCDCTTAEQVKIDE